MIGKLFVCSLCAAAFVSTAGAAGILRAPSALEASNDSHDHAILVSWTAVPGAESYHVYRSDTSNWLHAEAIGVTSDTAFIDPITSRKPHQNYVYWVYAEAGNTVSTLSAPAVGQPRVRPGGPRPNPRLRQEFQRMRGLLKR